ncbi:MAG: PAS domain S-box protein [Terracidiphilus sp.]|jgi:PAS domain S-box-containing protein
MMNQIPGPALAAQAAAQPDPLDELPVAYVEMDAHGAITRANRLTRSLHSSDAGELIGKPAWELMPPSEQEMSRAAFRAAMDSTEPPAAAHRFIYDASGQYRVYEMHRNVIRAASGQPTGMRVVTVDVTEAHVAHEEARRARLWLERVLASLADAIIVTDALGFVRTINPAAEALFGWEAGELTGRSIEEAFPMLSYLSGEKTEFSFARSLESPCRGTATLLDRQHREVRAEISASPIVDKVNGSTAGVVCVVRQLKEAL